eukprot:RCo003151
MPALVLFGRRWRVGTDDFVWPSMFGMVLHGATVGVLAWNLCREYQAQCQPVVKGFTIFGLVVHCCCYLEGIAMVIASGTGTPFEVERRWAVPVLLYLLLLLLLADLVFLLGITVVVAYEDQLCSCLPAGPRVAILVMAWCCTTLRYFSLALFYDGMGTQYSYEAMWTNRLRLLLSKFNTQESLKIGQDLREQVHSAFHGLDLIPSDVAFGILCLHAVEKLQPEISAASRLPISRATVSQPILDILRHFFPYCVASYGHSSVKSEHPGSWKRRLRRLFGRREIARSNDPKYWDAATVLYYTSLPSSDVLFVDMENDVYRPAYILAIDHKWRSVVVAFRGTSSVHDALTDASFKMITAEFRHLGSLRVSEGFWKASKNSKEKLDSRGRLAAALRANPGYALVLTGHSLGGAVAMLVGLLYHVELGGAHPVRCYAFSPPPAFSEADYTSPALATLRTLTVSCVRGDDLVPRFCFRSLMRWKDRIIRAVGYCRQPKWRVVLELVYRRLWLRSGPRDAARAQRMRASREKQVWPFLLKDDAGGNLSGGIPMGQDPSLGCGNPLDQNWLSSGWAQLSGNFRVGNALGPTGLWGRLPQLPSPLPCGGVSWGVQEGFLAPGNIALYGGGPGMVQLGSCGSNASRGSGPTDADEDLPQTPQSVVQAWRAFTRRASPRVREGEAHAEQAVTYPEELPEMTHAGPVVHLVRRKEAPWGRCPHCERPYVIFDAVWKSPQEFRDIVTSNNMLDDHKVFVIQNALLSVPRGA